MAEINENSPAPEHGAAENQRLTKMAPRDVAKGRREGRRPGRERPPLVPRLLAPPVASPPAPAPQPPAVASQQPEVAQAPQE